MKTKARVGKLSYVQIFVAVFVFEFLGALILAFRASHTGGFVFCLTWPPVCYLGLRMFFRSQRAIVRLMHLFSFAFLLASLWGLAIVLAKPSIFSKVSHGRLLVDFNQLEPFAWLSLYIFLMAVGLRLWVYLVLEFWDCWCKRTNKRQTQIKPPGLAPV